jgi:hypothetical protein
MRTLDDTRLKHSFPTHVVPRRTMAGGTPLQHLPAIGDLAGRRGVTLDNHKRVERQQGTRLTLFEGGLLRRIGDSEVQTVTCAL